MAKLVKRAYKYRFYPTDVQAQELARTFGCARKVWNLALDARTTAWYQRQQRVGYVQTSALLTEWKRSEDLAFLNEVSCVPLQQTLRHLQGAFAAFWDKRARYPKFKSRKKSRASAEYTRSAFRYRDGQLTLAKMAEPLDIHWSRPLPEGAEPSTVTVSPGRGRALVRVPAVRVPDHPAPPAARWSGLTRASHPWSPCRRGRRSPTPATRSGTGTRLALTQRRLSRKAKGSENRAGHG